MDFGYAIAPFVAWLVAGSTKFVINSLKARQLAFGQIGYGGLPSNHSAIVSSAAAMVAIREGISHPAFGGLLAHMRACGSWRRSCLCGKRIDQTGAGEGRCCNRHLAVPRH